MTVFVVGLALIVIGTGHFKPCVSVMVGQLYPHDDARRDGAFTIFYMGINLGAFLSAFVCGTLGERVGWHWGFGSAAVGMLAGLALYVSAAAALPRRHRAAAARSAKPPRRRSALAGIVAAVAVAALYHAGAIAELAAGAMRLDAMLGRPWLAARAATAALVAAAAWFVAGLAPGDRGPTATIFVFMLFNAVFWLRVRAGGLEPEPVHRQHTDRRARRLQVPDHLVPVGERGLIFLLAPLFAVLWSWLGRRGRDPHQPVKIALGLALPGARLRLHGVGRRDRRRAGVTRAPCSRRSRPTSGTRWASSACRRPGCPT